MTATGILSALLIGVLIGTLGRLVLPGRQNIGAVATVAVGIVAALVGGWASRRLGWDDNAGARWDWDWIGLHLTWSWATLGVQLAFAVLGILASMALTRTWAADDDRPVRRRRRSA
ncbi:membrane protein [Catellatospora sp. TT07R-123]|uniref:GlsB/YeaQ/YmgE family stress response membrane protein n=1 Tax=Catellatospora sp. TT07R-123 TaxID=2733863 RepID=UPI001B15981B|nr:GlsB/YeaQ/YmgE family stress response membrane protein [Catellatospora sp. TT07R-123]GHJ42660.1 membrane protein [Catellatospora sp. TT07R-123]